MGWEKYNSSNTDCDFVIEYKELHMKTTAVIGNVYNEVMELSKHITMLPKYDF